MANLDKVLTQGVEQILSSREGLEKLISDKKITLYQGFDPTAPSLHIGHFIGLRKLAQFQKLGHKVIFLVGDFTAMIGDPTDKSATRKRLTKGEVKTNFENYKSQASKIIDFDGENAAKIRFNSDWLTEMNFEQIIDISSSFTVQQLMERDMFQERIKSKKPIYLHEFLYPLMQGYDSVKMDVDLEVGGNDQLFNMMAGRTLMKGLEGKDKYVMTMKLLTDPSGKKMGKTEGNVINLDDSPENIFGKIMAFPDSLIKTGFELLTDVSEDQISDDPMANKKLLATELVKQINDIETAENAQKHFEQTFQQKSPDYSEEVEAGSNLANTIASALNISSTESKRLISQSAVTVNDETTTDFSYTPQGGDKIKAGKKKFFKIK